MLIDMYVTCMQLATMDCVAMGAGGRCGQGVLIIQLVYSHACIQD